MSALLVLVVLSVVLWPAATATSGETSVRLRHQPPRSWLTRWRRSVAERLGRPGARDDGWVADLADVVVVGLEAGLDLPRAVHLAARSPTVRQHAPWLEPTVSRAVQTGTSVGDSLGDRARGEGPRGSPPRELELLTRAWRLSEEVGAAASATTAAAAESLRTRRAQRQRAGALSAGPRASMWLLTGLPLLGPAVGMLVGVDPGRMYATGAAQVGATAGLLLTLGGWLWARRLLRRAARPATTSGGPH